MYTRSSSPSVPRDQQAAADGRRAASQYLETSPECHVHLATSRHEPKDAIAAVAVQITIGQNKKRNRFAHQSKGTRYGVENNKEKLVKGY